MEDRFLIDYDMDYKTEFIVDLERQERLYTHDVVDVAHALSRLNRGINELRMENKQLKLDLRMFKSVNEFINNYGIEKAKEVLLQSEKTKIQSQNSKAIEVLERLRNFYDLESNSDWVVTCYELDGYINDQITELRGGEK